MLLLPLLWSLGCQSESTDPLSKDETTDSAESNNICSVDALNFTPNRVTQGGVLWLPRPSSDCNGAQWTLQEGASSNAIIDDTEDYPRITLDAVGKHVFQLGAWDNQIEVSVLASTEVPYHNLSYFPAQSLLTVDNDIWVALPEVNRISAYAQDSLQPQFDIAVGSWPVALAADNPNGMVYVAEKGSDSLGIIDTNTQQKIDTIWVGDEPSNIVLSPDGKLAYLSLPTESAVAVVDLENRTRIHKWPAVNDAYSLALTNDGTTLYALAQRSGHTDRYPFEPDAVNNEIDAVAIDTNSGEITKQYLEIGGTNNAILLAEDEQSFYITSTIGDGSISLTTGDTFQHVIRQIDVNTREITAEVDISNQMTSTGFFVTAHQMTFANGLLWVVAEGNDQLVALDIDSLEEIYRQTVEGLPRTLLSTDDAIFVHGSQGYKLHHVSLQGELLASTEMAGDPRTESIALGQKLVFGAGVGFAQNYSCNSCHVDNRGDTRIWLAGFLDMYEVPRPFFWLEGTAPIGWGGYVETIQDFSLSGSASIGKQLSSEEAAGIKAYMSSIMAAPAANGKTQKDGSLSPDAQLGKELYEGKAGCAGCHALPLTTNNETLEEGVTFDSTSIPSLVGAYRYGVWLKHGEGKSLAETLDYVLDWMGNEQLNAAEKELLVAYLEELTDRHFFVLSNGMRYNQQAYAVDKPLVLTMNKPIWDGSIQFELQSADGKRINCSTNVNGRYLTITPNANLSYATDYTLSISQMESFEGRSLFAPLDLNFRTAKAPAVELDGSYLWTTNVPAFNPVTQEFSTDTTAPFVHLIEATKTASGADITVVYDDDLIYETSIVIDGQSFASPPLPISFGNSIAESTGIQGSLLDTTSDGIADVALGKLRISGPGIWLEDVFWELATAPDPDACEPGESGDFVVSAQENDDKIEISWEGGDALAVYVTDYSATLPVGPGQTVGFGNTYWAIQTTTFPEGFSPPVKYQELPEGSEDISELNDGTTGGVTLERGQCYKFSVTRDDFTIGSYTLIF